MTVKTIIGKTWGLQLPGHRNKASYVSDIKQVEFGKPHVFGYNNEIKLGIA